MDEYKYKVFISYCSEDKVYADFIYEKLKTYVPTKEILQEINITKKIGRNGIFFVISILYHLMNSYGNNYRTD